MAARPTAAEPTSAPLARSYLYAPGNREHLLDKVFEAGADAVILDLEDAVPGAEKEDARLAVRERVQARADRPRPAVWVRIGALSGDAWEADVDAVVEPGLVGLRVPKAESLEALDRLERLLTACEESAEIEPGTVRLAATIESATGLMAVTELAACRRLDLVAFGATDFLADIAADPAAEAEIAAWVRPQLVVASRAAGLAPPVAPVWTHLDDEAGLERTTETYRRAGFFGRSLIHPRQIAAAHRVFTPSPEEIERARRLLATYDEAVEAGRGATRGEDGEFIDAAVARRARGLLELAERLEVETGAGELV